MTSDNASGSIGSPPPLRHPLPWRNTPFAGENHVIDANGKPVYNGADAAEMFRLYDLQAQAEAR